MNRLLHATLPRSVPIVALIILIIAHAVPVCAQLPPLKHVVLVVLENHGYDSTMKNMPFLRELGNSNAVVTNFYANHHPSIGNYFLMTSGRNLTNDDGYKGTDGGSPNLVSQLLAAHKTGRSTLTAFPRPATLMAAVRRPIEITTSSATSRSPTSRWFEMMRSRGQI